MEVRMLNVHAGLVIKHCSGLPGKEDKELRLLAHGTVLGTKLWQRSLKLWGDSEESLN